MMDALEAIRREIAKTEEQRTSQFNIYLTGKIEGLSEALRLVESGVACYPTDKAARE